MAVNNKFKIKFSSQSLGKIKQDDVVISQQLNSATNKFVENLENGSSKIGKTDLKQKQPLSDEVYKSLTYFESIISKPPYIGSLHTISSDDVRNNFLSSNIKKVLLEDNISNTFSDFILNKSKLNNEKYFSDLDSKYELEFQNAEKLLSFIRSTFDNVENFNNIVNSNYAIDEVISKEILQKFQISFETLSTIQLSGIKNLFELFVTENSKKRIKNKTNTATIDQLLKVVSSILTKGYSTAVFNKPIIETDISDDQNSLTQVNTTNTSNLQNLSQYSDKNIVLGLSSNLTSYVDLDFYPKLLLYSLSKDSFVLSLTTMLCNELTISAGLGRLAGTNLGNRFGSNSSKFVDTFLGVDYLQTADTETAQSNSLNDYLLISDTGNRRIENTTSKKVFLLDGSNSNKTSSLTNSYDEFIKSIIQNGTKNRFSIFDSSLVECIKAFDESIYFYKKLMLKDANCNLLLQKNLYARLMYDLSSSMNQLSFINNINKNDIAELCLLKTLSSSYTYNSSSNVGKIKNFLLSLVVRKSAAILTNINYSEDSQQTSKKSSAKTNIKVTKKGEANAGDKVDEYTIETSQNETSNITNYISTNEIIRFCNDNLEKNILTDFSDDILTDISLSLTNLSQEFSSKGQLSNESQTFTINSRLFVDHLIKSNTTIISKLSKIFVDLCNEALKLSKLEDNSSNWLNENRLTRNSRLNGSLICSMLLESMLSLVEIFVDTKILNSNSNSQATKILIPEITSLSKIDNDLIKTEVSNIGSFEINVSIGKQSKNAIRSKALALLSQGMNENTFNSIINSDGRIPNLDLKQSSEKISETLTFNDYISNAIKLSNERDIITTILLSIRTHIENVYQQTRQLKDTADKLLTSQTSGDISSFIQFSKKQYGIDYLKDISNNTLDISNILKNRLLVNRQKRLTSGQYNCINVLVDGLKKSNCTTYNFFYVFLPKGFIANFESTNNTNIMNFILSKKSSITTQQYENINYKYSTKFLFDESSFDNLEPMSEDEIYSNIKLTNGQLGSSLQGEEFEILKNEARSFLFKKMLATISSVASDEFSIKENRTQENVSDLSQQLMRILLSQTGFSNDLFDKAFVSTESGTITNTDYINGLLSNNNLDFGTLDLLYDLINLKYFKLGIIEKSIFSDVAFDKCYVICTNDTLFSKVNNNKNNVIGSIKQNYRTQQNQLITDNNIMQKTFEINEYTATVTK